VPREKDLDMAEALRLAEQALVLDPNDARVHNALGYICLSWRNFEVLRSFVWMTEGCLLSRFWRQA